jgi:DMSO/TMAO reductase YedYZ heme-binding membrane subunit
MSLAYRAIGWNRQKRLCDLAMASALLLGLVVYGGTVYSFHPDTTAETFVIRFSALAAVLLLHVILAIGPLVRLNSRFLPLLYNRRHLGVTMFLLALLHGSFAIVQFHAGGNLNPLISVLTSYRRDYLSFLLRSRSDRALSLRGPWTDRPFDTIRHGRDQPRFLA